MSLGIIDCHAAASGRVNEDRAGVAHDLAWVIDGATDVIKQPLTDATTDADWIAGRLDATLTVLSAPPPVDISRLPDLAAARLAAEFAGAAKRPPRDRTEHPSAAAIIVRNCGVGIDYVSVGDCTLLAEGASGFVRVGVGEAAAGDPDLAKTLAALHAEDDGLQAEAALARIMPSIKAGRAAMNQPDGYGVFSITPTPPHFVRNGQIVMLAGGHILLASDGLMRLVDVFRLYTAPDLLTAARNEGLRSLLQVLRKAASRLSRSDRAPMSHASSSRSIHTRNSVGTHVGTRRFMTPPISTLAHLMRPA